MRFLPIIDCAACEVLVPDPVAVALFQRFFFHSDPVKMRPRALPIVLDVQTSYIISDSISSESFDSLVCFQ